MDDAILLATDGSDAATKATERAVDLASSLEATLFVLTVLESRTEYDNAIVDPEKAERHRRERATEILEDVTATADDAGVAVETAVRSGIPHEEIRRYAGEEGTDVIVIGARGHSSFHGSLLGSTVDRLLRSTSRSVLVVGGTEQP
ncbi:Nucleotide-binding universal stress protein, UspA family [Natronorubrum sediminis]|uniref:Nucleotide-binding universal stress protein, UspA family n=1 Tax=Natronorubrum sediminis TaxID=640943 RepID=A0A1H6FKP7_9EURY|nr:universal stress protein [Natronorubrum sediminis]SEH11431.1 Nucleotide-binding universal stress protein, UspA family [Natronorubrum sediminis]